MSLTYTLTTRPTPTACDVYSDTHPQSDALLDQPYPTLSRTFLSVVRTALPSLSSDEMAAVVAAPPATPQRSLPGGFINTPAPAPTIFAPQAASLRQNAQPPATDNNAGQSAAQSVLPVERAARTINDTLASEARFPELESYIAQGMSADYDMPTNPAWLPFQKMKMYDLPPRIMEQANQSIAGMSMGVMPAIGHAWVIIDHCLYLWDYTMPNPELIGFEESSARIQAIKLITPKPGIFVQGIAYLIVVATDVEMLLLGVAPQTTSTGAKTIALYNTRMSINIRGLKVDYIDASKKSGRIFFTGTDTDDIYEFQYQQDEGWFRGKTSRICHTRKNYDFVPEPIKTVGQYFGSQQKRKGFRQIVVDDTRDLLYTLSVTSEVKVWLIGDQIKMALSRPFMAMMQNTGHFTGGTELLYGRGVHIKSISAILATEAKNLSLMAMTNTGCRLYISATRGFGMQADVYSQPTSMQVLHVRFPPKDSTALSAPSRTGQPENAPYGVSGAQVDIDSKTLLGTEVGYRFAPGYCLAYQPNPDGSGKDRIFCSAPDSARLKNSQDTSTPSKTFSEFGQWIQLPSKLEQVQEVTQAFGAATTPFGFGNELTVQFDKTSTEIAIMTSAGVQTIRRRRLVDVFAGMMRYASSDDEGREGDIKRFVRTYGRGETAATALAVACGQGLDVSPDSRITTVTDPDVVEGARKAFIEHGGKPEYNANAIVDNSASPIDNVRPSPRHDGMALYISRLVRSIWKSPVMRLVQMPGMPLTAMPAVGLEKLRSIQRDLNTLGDFLNRNKNLIEGLAGPEALGRVSTRQEEIALQGEHRAMNSLMRLVGSIIEGISFVLVLFDERVEDILAALSDDSKRRAQELTFETLFVSAAGRELAKELVKAIVNRNIANGSNVDTVAEALRRRCGSFCSADDVVIFKAQELLNRASQAGSQSESSRVLLNESQRLFQKVAGSLNLEHLQWAVSRYVEMAFYAGAIQLCLGCAHEKDRARRALSWLKDGTPEGDTRREAFDARKECYEMAFGTINALDQATAGAPEQMDGQSTLAAKRRSEAYDVVNGSEDAVFQTCLYDWYIINGNADRLLDVESPYVVDYLRRRSQQERAHADLLWRYYAHHNDYLQAAAVQLDLARGFFELTLEDRIEYLSRAKTNANTRQTALTDSRQSKQQLLREIGDLLDVANIQDDLLQRMKAEPRLSPQRRPEVVAELDGAILPVEALFNQYADQAEYHDICLLIYQTADHRNPADIKASWEQLISNTNDEAIAAADRLPWESVGDKVREMGKRLQLADATFPIQTLLPLLERYAIAAREHHPPPTWPVDIFLDLEIAHETLLPILEALYYGNEHPFTGAKRKTVANHLVYLEKCWVEDSERKGERVLCGGEENASMVLDCLAGLLRGRDLEGDWRREAEGLAERVGRALR